MKRSHDDIEIETKKIVLFGESGIGKTTLFQKLSNLKNKNYTFIKKYNSTENFDLKAIQVDTTIGPVIIELWDTAGQETFGKLRNAYLRGADGVLLLYDMSNPRTITNLNKWLDQIKTITPTIPVAVLGNKADHFDDLQQTHAVKLRDCNLQRDIGHANIKNFLISIKSDYHIEYNTSFWTGKTDIKKKDSCLIGLEYLLSNIFNKPVQLL